MIAYRLDCELSVGSLLTQVFEESEHQSLHERGQYLTSSPKRWSESRREVAELRESSKVGLHPF